MLTFYIYVQELSQAPSGPILSVSWFYWFVRHCSSAFGLLFLQGVSKNKARLNKKRNKARDRNRRSDGVHFTSHAIANTLNKVNTQCAEAMQNISEYITTAAC